MQFSAMKVADTAVGVRDGQFVVAGYHRPARRVRPGAEGPRRRRRHRGDRASDGDRRRRGARRASRSPASQPAEAAGTTHDRALHARPGAGRRHGRSGCRVAGSRPAAARLLPTSERRQRPGRRTSRDPAGRRLRTRQPLRRFRPASRPPRPRRPESFGPPAAATRPPHRGSSATPQPTLSATPVGDAGRSRPGRGSRSRSTPRWLRRRSPPARSLRCPAGASSR